MTHEKKSRSTPSHAASDDLQPGAAAYNALLKQYGEAMIRIGQLELQLDHLTRQTPVSAGQPSAARARVAVEESSDIQALNARIESLQALITSIPQQNNATPAPTSAETEELRQMRLQMNNLSSQLQQTEQQLSSVQGGTHTRHTRRRGEHNRPLWKKVARKVGLSKSKSRRTRDSSAGSGDKAAEGG